MDRAMHAQHLALADRHIAEGKARIVDQIARIAALQARHADTTAAEQLLDLFNATMTSWEGHRQIIIAETLG
jgi:hypothetical protein